MWILQTHHSTMLKISNHTTHSTVRPCYPKPKDFKSPLNLIHAIILEQLHVHKTSHTFNFGSQIQSIQLLMYLGPRDSHTVHVLIIGINISRLFEKENFHEVLRELTDKMLLVNIFNFHKFMKILSLEKLLYGNLVELALTGPAFLAGP